MKIEMVLAAMTIINLSTAHAQVNHSCADYKGPEPRVQVHGRLAIYNGGYPNLRLWHIGTNHLFGIFDDQADLRCLRNSACGQDAIEVEAPANLMRLFHQFHNPIDYRIYGDFELQPLERYQPGHQQAACIVSARNLVQRQN
jgi:hypothetical protein